MVIVILSQKLESSSPQARDEASQDIRAWVVLDIFKRALKTFGPFTLSNFAQTLAFCIHSWTCLYIHNFTRERTVVAAQWPEAPFIYERHGFQSGENRASTILFSVGK